MADNTKQEESGLSRRDFMRSAAVGAAGAVALAGMMQKEALAAEPAKTAAPAAAAPATKPAALKIDDVMKAAREKLYRVAASVRSVTVWPALAKCRAWAVSDPANRSRITLLRSRKSS